MKWGKRIRAIIAVLALSPGISHVYGQTLTASFSVSPSKGNACGDSTFSFTSTSTYTGSGTVTYTWDFGDGSLPVTGSTANKSYSTADTFIVTLTAVSTDVLTDSTTDTIIVHPRPVADYSYSGIDCARNEFTFTDKSSVSSGNIVAYEWTFPDKKYTTAYPIYLFSNAGSFNIKLKIWTDKGCTDSVTKTIVIRERPISNFDYKSACQGANLTFDARIPKGTFHMLKWDFGDGNTYTSTSPNDTLATKSYANPGIYNVTLYAYNTTSGCADSITQQVPVFDKPTPKFVFRDFCTTDDSVYIINQVDPQFGEVSQISITWDHSAPAKVETYKGARLKDTLKFRYGVVSGTNKVGRYRVKVDILTTNGCQTIYYDSLRVYNVPEAGFILDDACVGDPVTFYDTSKVAATFGGAISKWLWFFGDTSGGAPNISTDQNPTHVYTESGTLKVILLAYNQGDCLDSVSGTIRVAPRPDAAFSFDPRCKQTAVPFTDETFMDESQGDTVVAWLWDFGDGSTPSTQKDPSHSFPSVDTYKVVLKVTTNTGCTDTSSQNVVILPDATADFTFSGQCERSPILFSGSATPPAGRTITGYLWDFGDGKSDNSGAKSVAHSFDQPNTYQVCLQVVTSEGCISDPVCKLVTVIPSPAAKFTTSPICVGRTVSFTNTTTLNSSETMAEYRWYYGDGTSSIQTAPNTTHTYNTAGVYKVSLVAITTKGCRDSIMQQIEVSPIPQANFIVKNTCNDSAVSFQDNSSVASGSIAQRTWKWGDGSTTAGNDPNPSHKYSTPGTYQVTLVITSAAGCTDSIQKSLTTYPGPTASFRYVSHCADSAIEFFDMSTLPGGQIKQWLWDFGDGGISTDQHPIHVYGGPFGGDYPVKLITKSSLGCTDDTTVLVKVHKLPKKTEIFFGGYEICEDEPFTYEESDGDNVGWFWNFGDGNSSTQSTGQHTYADSGFFNVILYLQNKKGCRDSFLTTVYVHPKPIVKFGWKGGCKGVDVVFRDSSTIYNKKKRKLLIIDFGDGFKTTMDSTIFHYKYNTPGTYTITYGVRENADEGWPKCEATIQKQITIYDNPAVGFKANTVCFEEITQFFDTTTGAGDIMSWEWDFGDNTTDKTNNPSPTHRYDADGEYDVTLKIKTKAGCEGSFTRTVTVLKKPVADFRLVPNPVSILKGEVEFENTSSEDATTYKWTFGDGDEATIKDPEKRMYNDTGWYPITLIVTNANGCSDTLTDSLRVKMDYTIHPPNILTLNGDGVNDEWVPKGEGVENYEVVIMDRWGQQVFHSTDFNESWKGDYNGNGVPVPEGVYIYQIKIVDFAQEEVRVVKGTITVIQ